MIQRRLRPQMISSGKLSTVEIACCKWSESYCILLRVNGTKAGRPVPPVEETFTT